MDWRKLFDLIPVAAGLANPALGIIAKELTEAIEKELDARADADPTFDRDVYIAEAGAEWDLNILKAEALRRKGHENDA